jgi:hypothetical protein
VRRPGADHHEQTLPVAAQVRDRPPGTQRAADRTGVRLKLGPRQQAHPRIPVGVGGQQLRGGLPRVLGGLAGE